MLMLVAILSSGCVTAYHKDETIERELAVAEASCMEQARIDTPTVNITSWWSPYPSPTTNLRLYDACMRSKGYTR